MRRIATALLGSVDLIAQPQAMAADFEQIMRQSMGRGVAEAAAAGVGAAGGAGAVRPPGVAPPSRTSPSRRQDVNPLTGAYPTGAWGDESRDYHVAVRLPAKAVGQEQLAARVQLAVGRRRRRAGPGQGDVVQRRHPDHADQPRGRALHRAGRAGRGHPGRPGRQGGRRRRDTATVKLGRAVQLAQETGNEEATTRLRKVVEIDDADTGTVRLKRSVDKLDEMALDTASTKTTRVKK